jgi:CheY-like chemotaxis protein
MNICYFEDDGSAARLEDVLNDIEGYTVETMHDYRDLAEALELEPECFDILIMDLILPEADQENMKRIQACSLYDSQVDLSPTIYFINHFISDRCPKFIDRIVLVSAYINDLIKKKGFKEQFKGFEIINKNDPDAVGKVLANVDAIVKKYNLL